MLVSFARPIAYNHAIYLTSATAPIAAAGFFLKPFYILAGFLPLLLVTEKNKRVHLFSFQVGLIGTMTVVSLLALHQSGMLASWLDVQFGFNLSSYSPWIS